MSVPLRRIPPVPIGFADVFVRDGWRGIEHCFGARTDLLLKWIEMSGGETLHQRRREHMRASGMAVTRRSRPA